MARTKTAPPPPGNQWTIVAIHDTRDVAPKGDRLVRVTGTGDPRPCDHCGTPHEVHVTVRDFSTGAELIVGSSCARGLGKVNRVAESASHPMPLLTGSSARWLEWRIPGTDETFRTERTAR